MRGFRIVGRHFVSLSSSEVEDLRECVEAYVTGLTSPSSPISPDIAEWYPEGTRVSPPVHERFWRLHAALANRTSGGKAETEPVTNGG